MNTPTLFDNLDIPMIGSSFGVDAPRARRTDPASSHRGADVSQTNKQRILDAVYTLVKQEGPLNGNEINELYVLRAPRNGWPNPIHFDSPRKRAGELAKDGVLVITNPDDFRNHIYDLPALERAA